MRVLVLALLLLLPTALTALAVDFVRGDVNGDTQVDISDAIQILLYLMGDESLDCFDSADTDDNGEINIADPVYHLHFLFVGDVGMPDPYPLCGVDPSVDSFDCLSSSCP